MGVGGGSGGGGWQRSAGLVVAMLAVGTRSLQPSPRPATRHALRTPRPPLQGGLIYGKHNHHAYLAPSSAPFAPSPPSSRGQGGRKGATILRTATVTEEEQTLEEDEFEDEGAGNDEEQRQQEQQQHSSHAWGIGGLLNWRRGEDEDEEAAAGQQQQQQRQRDLDPPLKGGLTAIKQAGWLTPTKNCMVDGDCDAEQLLNGAGEYYFKGGLRSRYGGGRL